MRLTDCALIRFAGQLGRAHRRFEPAGAPRAHRALFPTRPHHVPLPQRAGPNMERALAGCMHGRMHRCSCGGTAQAKAEAGAPWPRPRPRLWPRLWPRPRPRAGAGAWTFPHIHIHLVFLLCIVSVACACGVWSMVCMCVCFLAPPCDGEASCLAFAKVELSTKRAHLLLSAAGDALGQATPARSARAQPPDDFAT